MTSRNRSRQTTERDGSSDADAPAAPDSGATPDASAPAGAAPEDAAISGGDMTHMFDALTRDGAAMVIDQCSPEERRALFDALLPWMRREGVVAPAADADGRVDVVAMMASPEVAGSKAAASQAQTDLTIAKDAAVDRVASEQDRAALDKMIAQGVAVALAGAAAIVPGAAGAELLAARAAMSVLPLLRQAAEAIPVKESDRGILRKGIKILHNAAMPIAADADRAASAAASAANAAGAKAAG